MPFDEIKGNFAGRMTSHSMLQLANTRDGFAGQCDGRYPSCDRCVGYGYKCSYSESGRSSQRLKQQIEQRSMRSAGSPTAGPVSSLRNAIAEYEHLCRKFAPDLREADRNDVLTGLTAINGRVENAFSNLTRVDTPQVIPDVAASPSWPRPRSLVSSERYLGEPSDVRFFNLVKHVLQQENPSERDDDGMDSYEQDDAHDPATFDASIDIPSPEVADDYLEMYFSTIHVAYPFIPRTSFMKTYRDLRKNEVTENIDIFWLALLRMSLPGLTLKQDSAHLSRYPFCHRGLLYRVPRSEFRT